MKYLLSILVMTLALLPFVIFFGIKGLWEFEFSEVDQIWKDYKEIAGQKYRKAFKIRRPSRF